ncbi:MAG: biopolymer transporter ExbD [Planctomycetaceae bacterium]|nr:biopolymer transporter ExbD [Planctomycetaceae bacterium]
MRVPVRPRSAGLEVNITPLIDVVFLLVIFFLVASHFARSEALEPVDLPTATQVAELQDPPRRLLVTILPDGSYHTGGRQVTLDDLEQMLAEGAGDDPASFAVHIRGDRTAHFEVVEALMTLCPRYGITQVGFKVLEAGGK